MIRTADDHKEWIWNEILQGRLRQGWGLSEMELPSGKHTPQKMKEWCDRYRRRGQEYWKGKISQGDAEQRYWILRQMTDIQNGDRIVVPKMPTWGSFCIAIAIGEYRFDQGSRDPDDDDFRHVIPLEKSPRIIPHLANADAQMVASSLKGYQSAVNTVQKDSVRDSIEALIKAESPKGSADIASLFSELGRAATEKIVDDLMSKLVGLQPNAFEALIRNMLERGGYRIVKTNVYDRDGGDADIIAEAKLPPLADAFDQQSVLLVQVKKKEGIDYDDVTAVNQVLKMAEAYPMATLAVISTAGKFTDACERAAKDRVTLITGRTLARMLLRYMLE